MTPRFPTPAEAAAYKRYPTSDKAKAAQLTDAVRRAGYIEGYNAAIKSLAPVADGYHLGAATPLHDEGAQVLLYYDTIDQAGEALSALADLTDQLNQGQSQT